MSGSKPTPSAATPTEPARRPRLLHLVRIETDRATADLLQAAFDAWRHPVTAWHDEDHDRAVLDLPGASAAATRRHAARLRRHLRACLPAERLRIEAVALRDEDWREAWKRHFHIMRFSPRLVVRPSWEAYTPRRGEQVIVLDPGMSFGTGQHHTTRACLRLLDRLARARPGATLLDIGCGSGILAIAAARLGYTQVTAFDNDPVAVRHTCANAQLNAAAVTARAADLAAYRPRRPFDVVVANVLADVLIAHARAIGRTVADTPTARLILSGILSRQYPAVLAAYRAAGWRACGRLVDGEWTTGVLRRAEVSHPDRTAPRPPAPPPGSRPARTRRKPARAGG